MSKEHNSEDKDKALHISEVTKRLYWISEEMNKVKPFSQSHLNWGSRYNRLLNAKKILDEEGLWRNAGELNSGTLLIPPKLMGTNG